MDAMSDLLYGQESYHRFFSPKAYLNSYYNVDGDTLGNSRLLFKLKHLAKIFTSGKVKGETLIDIGTGPTIYQLLSACEAFSNIIVSDLTEANLEEFNKWLLNKPGAFDWSPVVKYVCHLEGDRVPWEEKEEQLRRAIKQVLKCDVLLSNPTDPVVLPQVDCVLSCACLEAACKEKEDYIAGLNNLSALLKPGGYLVLTGVLESRYYVVGESKFLPFHLTKDFMMETLNRVGFVIESFEWSGEKKEPWEKTAKFLAYYVLVAQKKV
ncbi:nicotinamide N-methyltransferase-like [Hyperolius riggenbachi]|uniref:nicotinamide N-methyltransferase-like n=1 Tax=Hyperolius riggenbachi TaxID=752182 RepID=UPI0035A2CEB0